MPSVPAFLILGGWDKGKNFMAEKLTKEKLDSWYTPKIKVTEEEEEVMEGDKTKCEECGKVDCMCYEDYVENQAEFPDWFPMTAAE